MADLNFDQSLVLRELVTRMRISDVMTTTLHTATPTDSLRSVQRMMKERRISGVPVVDDQWQLIGIVTIDDIIRALDFGYIEEPVGNYMTKDPVTVEENHLLAMGISLFEHHTFHRFPVVNRDKKLVGVLTGRDILNALLSEINEEVDKLESLLPEEKTHGETFFYRKFPVIAADMERAGSASTEIKKFCKRSNFSRKLTRRVGVAAFELEINIAVHSNGGSLTFLREEDYVRILAHDSGPGIPDIEKALTEGFSTANDWVRSYGFGAGMGLPNIKRVSDEFHISSDTEHGTMITATFKIE